MVDPLKEPGDMGSVVLREARNQERFFHASRKGDGDAVKHLVEAGCDVNGTTQVLKKTPVMFAAERGHLDVVTYLMEAGGM
mmetsp:Transcript_14704/g.37574  ORF Transcript_14704/g.37574 Transcript_14704/m.37574 type:complete len:81 (+) Transcript_14704:334-576(+)